MTDSGSTPRIISNEILKLCESLVPNPQPLFLPVTPLEGAVTQECFPVVNKYVLDNGGSICYGWQIWEWPFVTLEAEFHAVWKEPGGELHDITPKRTKVTRILFLPDESKTYQGVQVKSIVIPLSNQPDVADFITAIDAEFEIMNRGERATQHGMIELPESESSEYYKIMESKRKAALSIHQRMSLIGRNSPCPCGNGKKYKRCHGQ